MRHSFRRVGPQCQAVSVIGDFNGWSPQSNALGSRGATGVWEGFVPDVAAGALYKYHITSQYRDYQVDKADPHAFAAEIRPQTTLTGLADLSGQSPAQLGVSRLLHRAHGPVPGPVRVSGAGARPAPHPPLRRDCSSHRRVDGPATSRGLSMGQCTSLSAASP